MRVLVKTSPAMHQSDCLIDEEIRLLLMEEDTGLQAKGLDQLLKLYQTRICRLVQKMFPYFRESELVDVLYELFRSLKKMLDEKRVDFERPLGSLLFQIASFRAHDLHRRLTNAKRQDEKYLTDMAVILAEEGYSPHWRNLVRNGTSTQILEEFAQLLTTLPRRQAAIAQAMADALRRGTNLPLSALAHSAKANELVVDGVADLNAWCPNTFTGGQLWQEVVCLGNNGRTLTLLSLGSEEVKEEEEEKSF